MKKACAILAMFFMLYTGLTWGVIGVIVNAIASDLGISNTVVIASFTFFSISATVMTVLSTGIVLEVLKLKRTILMAIVTTLLGAISIFITSNPLLLKISLLLFGVGFGMCFAMSYYLIVIITDSSNRASKMAFISF